MFDLHIAPLLLQVLRNKPAVTVMLFSLAAQEAAAVQNLARHIVLDLSRSHEIQELTFIQAPGALMFFVGVQDVLSGCQLWKVYVINVADCPGEVPNVIAFSESGE